MSKPAPPLHRKGFYFEVKAGEQYLWCRCGRSQLATLVRRLTHEGTAIRPVAFPVPSGTRRSSSAAASTRAPGPSATAATTTFRVGIGKTIRTARKNREVRLVCLTRAPGRVQLDGILLCLTRYLAGQSLKRARHAALLHQCSDPALGRDVFSLSFMSRTEPGISPIIVAEHRHTVLFISSRAGRDRSERTSALQSSRSRACMCARMRRTESTTRARAHCGSSSPTDRRARRLVFGMRKCPPKKRPRLAARSASRRPSILRSGTPWRSGTFSFSYTVNKAPSVMTQFIGNIPALQSRASSAPLRGSAARAQRLGCRVDRAQQSKHARRGRCGVPAPQTTAFGGNAPVRVASMWWA